MSVLIKPIITEKMTADSELHNRYGFVVNPKANKFALRGWFTSGNWIREASRIGAAPRMAWLLGCTYCYLDSIPDPAGPLQGQLEAAKLSRSFQTQLSL